MSRPTNRKRAVAAVNRSNATMTRAEAESFVDDLIAQIDQTADHTGTAEGSSHHVTYGRTRSEVRAVMVKMFQRMAVYEHDYSVALHESLLERKPAGGQH